MFKKVLMAVTLAALTAPAFAGIVVYEDEDGKKLEIGGRIQLQYRAIDGEGSANVDELFFRRLRPYIQGTVTPKWDGKIQFDFGQSLEDDEVKIKDAWMRYKADGFNVKIGNQKPYFSREFLTSSKRQQLVERTFLGDHNFGTPDRALGVGLDGKAAEDKVSWGAFAGNAMIDPAAGRLDFDTPVNRKSDWNEGWLASGRVDFHPFGFLKMEQGDFKGDLKATIGVAAFTWSNDGDRNTRTDGGIATDPGKPDVDSASGFEVSGGLRVAGFSADAEYQMISADTIDPTVTSGLFVNGSTDLDKYALEGGFMVIPKKFEVVAGYESLDADGYQSAWDRTSLGANYFWNKYKVKLQGTYRMGDNVAGVSGIDVDTIMVQMQFVF